MNLDTSLFLSLNNLSYHSQLLNGLGVFFAEYSQYVLGLIVIGLLFYPVADREQNRTMVLVSVVAALIARGIVKTVVLLFYARPRPYMVLPSTHKLIGTYAYENLQSFPSGHAIF